ncbi:hypothetical protein GH714_022396 [Hevea brasiliensis]|uniref:Uncharacterized protein n=1 Tax=Hevea brasiliensis TaxID=3981 RepID=A0A6A6M266_HEVBR|nr:hypothetical protein GH714_022396 [Hevea brasiliensis]
MSGIMHKIEETLHIGGNKKEEHKGSLMESTRVSTMENRRVSAMKATSQKDSFLLHSVVVHGVSIKDPTSNFDVVPLDWFTAKKKQVFIDSGIRIMFVGSPILAQLVVDGAMDEIREVLERSDQTRNLEFEPDVELQSRSGSTPLEAAAGAGANVDALAKDGNTALHLAVEERRRDCARLLLAGGAKADIRDTTEGDTPLHIAARVEDESTVKLILQKGANKDIRNKSSKTAYAVAAEYGHSRLFDSLKLGDSLCIAARKGEVRTMLKLIENGANINGGDPHGWTALHRAAFKGKVDAVRALLDKGLDIDAKDEDGYTALHCAVESGHADVIELLLKKGTDAEAREDKGVTALQIDESLHHGEITRVIQAAAAAPVHLPFGKGMAGKEVEKPIMKRPPRASALRGIHGHAYR